MVGELDGVAGAWGFAEGGMGSVSEAIALSAKEHGAEIFVNSVSSPYILEFLTILHSLWTFQSFPKIKPII